MFRERTAHATDKCTDLQGSTTLLTLNAGTGQIGLRSGVPSATHISTSEHQPHGGELNYAGTSPERETGEWNLKHLIQNDLVRDMKVQLLKSASAPVKF